LSEKFSANIAGQLVAGLKHIHDKGFAHLDLKPSNLLLHSPLPRLFLQTYNAKESKFDDVITRDFAEVKICDFGLATQKNRMRGGFGSFHYMAPEILVSLL
jgi:serine/threonine protein kinase